MPAPSVALPTDQTVDKAADIDAILKQLDSPLGEMPVEAIRAARRHRDEIIPGLIELIDRARRNALDGRVPESNGHFFALFLLAEFRAKQGLSSILDAVSLPDDLPFKLFGDAIHETLPCAFVAMAADQVAVLESLIRNRDVNGYVRWAAATGLAKMVAAGERERQEIVEVLRGLLREAMASEDREGVVGLINTLTDLYPEEAYEEIREAYRQGLVDEGVMGLEDVDRELALGRDAALSRLAEQDVYVTDTIETLQEWHAFRPAPERKPLPSVPRPKGRALSIPRGANPAALGAAVAPAVVRQELKTIGRNDCCPCGSGKKFKRCCGSR